MAVTADEANEAVKAFMLQVVERLRPRFPLYSAALAAEIHGKRMTSDCWHRIASVLASMHSIPGATFSPFEHDNRNLALSAVAVALKMAGALFNSRRPESDLEFAVWRSARILETFDSMDRKET